MNAVRDFVRRIGAIAALALIAGGPVAGAGEARAPMSFEDAWQTLRAANPALAAARLEVERRVEERRAAASLAGPQIELTGRYTFINDPIVIDLDPIRRVILALHPTVPGAAVPPFTLDVQDDRFLRGQLTALWPVYTGGRVRAAQRAAVAGQVEAEAASRQTADTLFGELVRRFYGAQLARVARATRAAVLAGLEEHARHATRLEAEGFIARAERLHAQVARDEAWRELRRAERQVEIAEVALGGLLATDGAVAPDSPLFIIGETLEPLDGFISSSAERHPALAVVEARRAQVAEAVVAERGRLKPEVFVFGSKELNRGDLTLLDPDWAVGAGVRLVLWDRNDRTHRLAAARLLERRVGLLAEDARRNLRTLVEKSHREAALAQEQFGSLASTLELARENLRVREAAFREGQGTSLDVVDARLTLARAETARAVTAHDFILALATLLEASGQPERFPAYEAAATERILP